MLRIVVVALVLSTAPAWAYKPLVCAPNTDPSEQWFIDGKTIEREFRDVVIRHDLSKHRRHGGNDSWVVTLDDGAPPPPSGLKVTKRRTMEWLTGNTAFRGTCRETTAEDRILHQRSSR